MPQANTSLPPMKRNFAGIEFLVPQAFDVGHALTADEASWVNSQLATVVGNQFGGYVRRAIEAINDSRTKAHKAKTYDGPLDDSGKRPAQATFADLGWNAEETFNDLFTEYSFAGNRRGDGTTVARDPVTALVQFLAKEAIKAKIKAKGLKVKTFMDTKVHTPDGEEISKFMELVGQYIAAHPELTDTAKAQLAADSDTSDDLDLSLPEETPSEDQKAA